jgi:hypothetical protein
MNEKTNIQEILHNVASGEHFMAARIASLVMPNTVAVERVEV